MSVAKLTSALVWAKLSKTVYVTKMEALLSI